MKLTGRAAAASIFALTLSLGACSGSGSDKSAPETTEDEGTTTIGFYGKAVQQETITIGYSAEAPYSFEQDGELQGASIALAKAVYKELGIDDIEGVNTDFGSLIPGLNAERFDAISAGMAILPERCDQAAFGDPEIMYTTALMTKTGQQDGMQDLDDVKEKGVTLATVIGSVESGYAEDLAFDTVKVGTTQEGMDAVTTGRADVFASDAVSLNWLAQDHAEAGVEVSDSFVQEIDGIPQIGAGASIFRTDDDELRAKWNRVLDEIVSDEKSYLDIVGDYGITAAERPDGSITTDQLCEG